MIARIDEWYRESRDVETLHGHQLWALVEPEHAGVGDYGIIKLLTPDEAGGHQMTYLSKEDGDIYEIDPVDVPEQYLVAALKHDLLGDET